MQDFNLSEEEEKSLIGILYNHLSFATTLEVFNEITPEGLKRTQTLRDVLEKLLKKYGLSDKLDEQTCLLLGLTDFIKKETMEQWVSNENNKHLQLRAKYFLNK